MSRPAGEFTYSDMKLLIWLANVQPVLRKAKSIELWYLCHSVFESEILSVLHTRSSLQVNSFQLVLATDGVSSYVMFLYREIQWTTGDKSGGSGGFGGSEAVVGINTGDRMNYISVIGSGMPEIVDVETMSNIMKPGVFMYRTDTVKITPTPCKSSTQWMCDALIVMIFVYFQFQDIHLELWMETAVYHRVMTQTQEWFHWTHRQCSTANPLTKLWWDGSWLYFNNNYDATLSDLYSLIIYSVNI